MFKTLQVCFHQSFLEISAESAAPFQRLERLLVTGEDYRDISDICPNYFESFVREHPDWSEGVSFVIFRDHLLLKDKPHAYVQRVQLSGQSCMHAPVAMQHYLVAMRRLEPAPMLDIAKYIQTRSLPWL